jgi:hypothetical protein
LWLGRHKGSKASVESLEPDKGRALGVRIDRSKAEQISEKRLIGGTMRFKDAV